MNGGGAIGVEQNSHGAELSWSKAITGAELSFSIY